MALSFALNYSREAAALLRAGAIEVDRWKCPPWPDLLAEALETRPVYVHFDLNAGGGRMDEPDWNGIERLMAATDTPYINLHLAPARGDYELQGDELTDSERDRVIAQMTEDVRVVAARFGPERVIVENIPYRERHVRKGRRFLRPAVEPAVFSQVLAETKTGMLFDIGHALITALTLQWDTQAYIQALPLERLRELHISGVRLHKGEPEDHLAMTETDWLLFERTLGAMVRGRAAIPWVVACEYGGLGEVFAWRSETAVIAEQAPRMVRMLRAAAVPEASRPIYPA